MNAILLPALLCSLAPTPEPEPPGGGVYYNTPQAVFDASRKASEKGDYMTVVDCIAPEMRRDYAASLVVQALMLKGVGLAGGDKAARPIKAVLDRHGLTDKALSGISLGSGGAGPARKARAAIAKLIKKPKAFAAEMMAAQQKWARALDLPGGLPKSPNKLVGVKVEGKKASGLAVMELGDTRVEYKVGFVKGPAGWRMLPQLGPPGAPDEGPGAPPPG